MSGQERANADLMRELWGSPQDWNVRKSYVDVAKKLGIDEETVRNRLRHLKESGFLLGWRLVPNPVLLGRRSFILHLEFDDSESKDEAISRLKQTEGVIMIASTYGNSLQVMVFDGEDRLSSSRIAKIAVRGRILKMPGMSLPPSGFRMTATDWKIVRLLLRDAERRITDVAAEVKLSERSVKRRLNSMMAASAIFVMPMVDQRKSDWVSYQLVVEARERSRSAVDSLVASKIDNLVFRAAASESGLIFGFNGKNVAEGGEILRWIKQQPGVKSSRMNIVEELTYLFDWLETETDRLSN